MELNTLYSSILPNLDEMIRVFRNEPINLYVNSIENKTGNRAKLPTDITAVVNSTFTKIGNYVIPIFDLDTSENAKRETFIINGAITEFDVVESKDSGIDATGTGTVGKRHNEFDVEGSIDSESRKIILGISLIPSDMHSGNYIPLKSTSNRVMIEKRSSANEFAFSILGSGFGFNNAITKSQGIHASITALVELSVAEVLGKLGEFPYWLLLKGGKVDRNVLSNLLYSFLREPLNKKIEQISYLLKLRGEDVEVTRIMNDNLKEAILKFKSEVGLPPDDTLSRDLYIALLT
ncbi:MAG: hypothetical protein GXO06_02300, partial [Epsilonproteobacteria bacterium]|nr:hypothetical protein [Campylobacterota bacterium]